jgi:hypothetical protein
VQSRRLGLAERSGRFVQNEESGIVHQRA